MKKLIRWYLAWCGICGRETEHDGFRCQECGK
jgi:DNA-directed RNA polymerase subunit RPC12/RpoP